MAVSHPSVTMNVDVELAFFLDMKDACAEIDISPQAFMYEALFRELLRCRTIIKKTSPSRQNTARASVLPFDLV